MNELLWVKSSASAKGFECVEVAFDGGQVHMRDSKDRKGPVLTFTPGEWTAFIGGAKAGEFDNL